VWRLAGVRGGWGGYLHQPPQPHPPASPQPPQPILNRRLFANSAAKTRRSARPNGPGPSCSGSSRRHKRNGGDKDRACRSGVRDADGLRGIERPPLCGRTRLTYCFLHKLLSALASVVGRWCQLPTSWVTPATGSHTKPPMPPRRTTLPHRIPAGGEVCYVDTDRVRNDGDEADQDATDHSPRRGGRTTCAPGGVARGRWLAGGVPGELGARAFTLSHFVPRRWG